MESRNTPSDLVDHVVGPIDVAVTGDRVSLYADVTGDDVSRWATEAPPGFASVLLFAVADEFLYHPETIDYTATLMHVDQSFSYLGPIRVGSVQRVEGTITRVRERAGSYFVTFEATARDGEAITLESVSTFLLSDQKAPPPETERTEPPVRESGANGATEDGWLRSASRDDLVRYSAATRDFNPFHWDHDAAVGAGMPGVVVHGLFMYAWLAQAAAPKGRVLSMKVRFRNALFAAEQALVTRIDGGEGVIKLALVNNGEALVTGTATVASQEE
jgi:hydroxyacyl-ACP dehydratase HTD2-like protein with hotdog domain